MKVYSRIRSRKGMCIKTIYNAVTGCNEERLAMPVGDGTFRMILRQNEIPEILEKYFNETLGDGSLNQEKRLGKLFVGLNK